MAGLVDKLHKMWNPPEDEYEDYYDEDEDDDEEAPQQHIPPRQKAVLHAEDN